METINTQTTETKTNRFEGLLAKAKTCAKYAGYTAGGALVVGGAYAVYRVLKASGADTAAAAVGGVAEAAADAVADAATEVVATALRG